MIYYFKLVFKIQKCNCTFNPYDLSLFKGHWSAVNLNFILLSCLIIFKYKEKFYHNTVNSLMAYN